MGGGLRFGRNQFLHDVTFQKVGVSRGAFSDITLQCFLHYCNGSTQKPRGDDERVEYVVARMNSNRSIVIRSIQKITG